MHGTHDIWCPSRFRPTASCVCGAETPKPHSPPKSPVVPEGWEYVSRVCAVERWGEAGVERLLEEKKLISASSFDGYWVVERVVKPR